MKHGTENTRCYLGIDLGTTGVKALLAGTDGKVRGTGYAGYPLDTPRPMWAEQDPREWWRGTCEAVAQAMKNAGAAPEDVLAIGLSGQMHGTVMLDQDGNVLYPAIIHCDQRAYEEKREILERVGAERLGDYVQNQPHSGFQATSLLWMRARRPDIYGRIRKVLLPKDYLRYLLTGEIAGEITDAGGTLLFDNAHKTWSGELLRLLDIPGDILPDPSHFPWETAGTLTASAARETGLREGTPVAYGGGDQPMQAVGNGILCPGTASVTLGTSGQIFMPADEPVYDKKLRTHTFCHAPENVWYVMGAVLNCCLAINWFGANILGDPDYRKVHELAGLASPGSQGLLFMPYLTGERTPHQNEKARAGFVGLTLRHGVREMARAVLEGIAFSLYDAAQPAREMGLCPKKYLLAGGGARSSVLRQILCDVFGETMWYGNVAEQAGLGAALCGAVAAGEYSSLQEACGLWAPRDLTPVEPDEERGKNYRRQFALFRELYRQNEPVFNTME